MPFGFGRRSHPVDANTATTTGHSAPREKTGRSALFGRNDRHNGATSHSRALHQRPTFGEWFKGTAIDIITMIILGAIGLGVYRAKPAPSRSFPVYFQDGEIVYPQFAYPLRHEIIPIWLSALISALVPIAVFLICQIRVRSFWDVNAAVIGLLYSLITAAVFQVFLKWLIGGLRPHFLAVCKPDVSIGTNTGNGLRQIMYDRSICTGDEKEINDSLESFPSGHTTAAFGGFVFLYLYINAKLKVFSNYHPSMWKLVATYAPILGATLIGGALTIDEYHNWYDVLAGAIIGTVMAFSSYRMVYASIWDFRFNHVPLMRSVPFTYGQEGASGAYQGFHDAVFTRQAMWGVHGSGSHSGAPFDASGVAGGQGASSYSNGAHVANGTGSSHTHGRHSIDRRPVGGRGEHMV